MESKERCVLRPFFEPRGVAVIGSLREGRGEGYIAIENMLRLGFAGRIYPVNPSYDQVLGMRAYPTVDDLEGPIDLAVVITPPSTVATIVERCARKGIRAVIVSTEGFAEAGKAGAKLQQQLLNTARHAGVRLIGPNTLGIVNTSNGLITNPYPMGYKRIRKGNIAYSSQSGVIGAHAQPMEDRSYHVGKTCDFGNKCDVDEADWLDYLMDDPGTRVIAMHMEAIKDGRRFMDRLRRTAARKPVFIFKTGRSEQGARASASHTGSLAQSPQICNDAFKQAGAIPVNTWQEFWEMPKVFESQPLPQGNRIAIVTLTGGVGVAATDVAVESGLAMAQFSDATMEILSGLSPNLTRNPIDVGPTMVLTDNPLAVYDTALTAVLSDPNVDCAAIILFAGSAPPVGTTVSMLARLKQRISKPMAVWMYGPRMHFRDKLSRQLEAFGLPAYLEMETAIRALGIAARYAKVKSELGCEASRGSPAITTRRKAENRSKSPAS